jgi:hypothetical protein
MRKFNFLIPTKRDRFLKLFLNSELLVAAFRYRIPASQTAIALPTFPKAIPTERFAIAPYQSNLRAIPTERFAITLSQSNLRAIALFLIISLSGIIADEKLL